MKKHLLIGILILFILNTAAFAVLADPKKDSEKPANNDLKENRLSDEEISRMSRRVETDNLVNPSLSENAKTDANNNLKKSNQIIVTHRHHGYYYGGAGLILVIILIVLLVG
jgi:hypothetical protein